MKNYLSLMNRIMTEGIICKDRTGVGRQKIFGTQLRFRMADGFPMLTTNPVPFKNPVQELLWMIHGSSDNKILNAANVNIWNQWAVKEKDIDDFVAKYFGKSKDNESFMDAAKASLRKDRLGDIGPIYGPSWRFAPVHALSPLFPQVNEDHFASDMLERIKLSFEKDLKDAFDAVKQQNPDKPDEEIKDNLWKSYLQRMYYAQVDQLQNLIYNLKHRPFSSRLVISTWIPSNLPFEELSPEENVLLGKGALAPCHVLQQYIVLPAENEADKPKLSLMLSQRSH